jgi:hypothetical protein
MSKYSYKKNNNKKIKNKNLAASKQDIITSKCFVCFD